MEAEKEISVMKTTLQDERRGEDEKKDFFTLDGFYVIILNTCGFIQSMYGVWGARERESTADKNGENKEEQHKNGQTKIGRKTPSQ